MAADNPEESRKNYASDKPVEEYRPLNVKDALTYLDKVKAKFSTQTQVYNQFLDIMKDFKSQMIDTPGVIERVSTLFKGHPILISGFNTFLPPGYCIECSIDDQERNIIKVTTPSGTTCINDTENLDLRQDSNDQQQKKKAPVEFNHAITYVNKIKSRFANQPDTYKKFLEILQTYQKDQKPIQEVYAEVQVLFNGSDELLDEFKQFLPEPKHKKKRSGNIATLSISKRTKHHHKTDLQTSDVRSNTPTDDLARPTFSAEEAEFFEKVKTYIGNKATYNAFLKVLNLFSQQIVDQNVLVSRVESFIGGNKDLFDWFKTLVGYDGSDEVIENLPRPIQRKDSFNDTLLCGPSYRYTPKVWQSRACSGRDALCWDVLNDTYISHSTWASEDTGFVAAKKNQYEEALHRVEEERYDYDLNIEANLNTIALLEPIAKKISIMSPEEKSQFKLPFGLDSPSRTIYQRIIKKIYGVEKGLEMIDLLHNNPAQTVPILLKRLKQKDDEWKRAQREWNKIWREVETKNYWKSLDYQGITFKLNDRKAMTTKYLVSQAENKRSEQQQQEFQFSFNDLSVFKDVSRLIYFFLERQPIYNLEDCESMLTFMNTMIPMFFDIDDVEPSTIDTTGDIILDEIVDEDDKSSVMSVDSLEFKKNPVTSRSTRPRRGQLHEDDGLLKDVLTRNLKKVPSGNSSDDEDDDDEDEDEDEEDEDEEEDDDGEHVEEEEHEGSNPRIKQEDDEEEDDDEEEEEEEDDEDEDDNNPRRPRYSRRRTRRRPMKHKKLTQQKKKSNHIPPKIATVASLIEKREPSIEPENQKTYNFFGDNGFYCFFRLYQVLYDRLCKMKALDTEFRNHPEKSKKAREEARDLGIIPRRFKALKMDTKNGYYNMLLALIDKLLEGEIDQQTYEECVRYNFGADAYIMFTIDKLVLSLVRHIHIIITDTQSQELYELFKNEHKAEKVDQGDVITYRTRVAGVIDSSENTYHITFKLKSRSLNIRLLDGNTISKPSEGCGGYNEYVSNYVDWANETKGIDQSLLTPRFLQRNLKYKGNQGKNIEVRSGMQYKICRDTYHMFYIIGAEDAFVRHCPKPKSTHSNWNHWIDKDWPNEQDKLLAEAKALSLLQ